MEGAERFLTSLAQALSAAGLYKADHPARQRVLDASFLRLLDLHEGGTHPVFTFLEYEVLLNGRPIPSLRSWSWARRLAEVGIQRVEVTEQPERRDYGRFVDELAARLASGGELEGVTERAQGFRYGALSIQPKGLPRGEAVARGDFAVDFTLEADAMEWVVQEARAGRKIERAEVEIVVKALGAVMHGSHDFLIPVLRLKDYDQYTTVHSLNVSVLAMAFGEFLGLDRGQIQALGVAGVLHDIGKVNVPKEILDKPGRPTEEEWQAIRAHPEDGARMILESDDRLELAAILAYEHHKRFDGGGYPDYGRARASHALSHLLQVCDVYDALATDRPYRKAKSPGDILALIDDGSGTEFDPHMASAFKQMMGMWDNRVTVFRDPDPEGRTEDMQPPQTENTQAQTQDSQAQAEVESEGAAASGVQSLWKTLPAEEPA